MGTYEDLKAAIQQVIRTNGNNEITGALLQQTFLSIVNSVGANAAFAGIATPSTNPGTADQNVFFLATEAGIYANFGGIEIAEGEVIILSNKTGVWTKTIFDIATQQQLISTSLNPFGGYIGYYNNSLGGLKEVARFYLVPNCAYQLIIKASEVITQDAVYVNGIYSEDGTRLIRVKLNKGESEATSEILRVESRQLVVLKSELRIAFEWQVSVEADEKEIILPNDSVKPSQLEDYANLPLLDGFKGGSSQDYTPYISELYIEPSFVYGNTIVGLRRYRTGIILRAFNSGFIKWSIVNTTFMDGKSNGDVIPFIITSAADSTIVGKTIGYMIFKDIDGFKELSSDAGDGQLVNLELCTKLFTQPNIWESLRIVSSSNTPSSSDSIEIYLPQQLDAVVGDRIQLFFRSIVDVANVKSYDIIASCSKGKSYPRYWEYTPTSEDAGNSVNLKVIVRDKADSILATKYTTINFVEKRTSPSSNKNVLCIGASATAGGQWVGELKRRLTETSGDGTPANPTGLGLSNFSFVGRKKGSVVPVSLEATGGWKVATYGSEGERAFRLNVTNVNQLYIGDTYTSPNGGVFVVQEINVTEGVGNIRCTFNSSVPTISASGTLTRTSGNGDATIQYTSYSDEYYSPFFNTTTNKVDFKTYADEWCGGHIDLMIWHCGVNDIFGGTDAGIDLAISTFETILTQFHADFPNGKVVISSIPLGSMNGGFAANYGASETANGLTFMSQAQKYAERLQELVSRYSSYAVYSPVMEEFDAEYGYPTKATPVNNRTSETEVVGTNAVHPTDAGSYMVADAIYRTINAMTL